MRPQTALWLLILICFGIMVAQVFTTILAYLTAFALVGAGILLFVRFSRGDTP